MGDSNYDDEGLFWAIVDDLDLEEDVTVEEMTQIVGAFLAEKDGYDFSTYVDDLHSKGLLSKRAANFTVTPMEFVSSPTALADLPVGWGNLHFKLVQHKLGELVYTQCTYINKDDFAIYQKGNGYICLFRGELRTFTSKINFIRFLRVTNPHYGLSEETRQRIYEEELYKQYLRTLVGFTPNKEGGKGYSSTEDIYIEPMRVNTLAFISKLKGDKEVFYSQKDKVLYVVDRLIYSIPSDYEDYDRDVVADYKEIVPHLDDIIKIHALSLRFETKRQTTLFIGGTSSGKSALAKCFGAVSVNKEVSYKQMVKGSPIAVTEAKPFGGILLVDDISQESMPKFERFKSFQDEGINVGSLSKRYTLDVERTIITAMTDSVFSNGGDEYYTRVLVIPLGSKPIEESSKLFNSMSYSEYFGELTKYVRGEMLRLIEDESMSKKDLLDAESKYLLDIVNNEYGEVLSILKNEPETYIDVLVIDDVKYIANKTKQKLKLAKAIKGTGIDVSAIWKGFELGSKQAKRVDGKVISVYKIL